MNIDLVVFPNGQLCIASDTVFDPRIHKVEYDRSQRMMVLFPENGESLVMEHVVPEHLAQQIESEAGCKIVITRETDIIDEYNVTLVQIGI